VLLLASHTDDIRSQDMCMQLLVAFGGDPYRRTLASETPYSIASREKQIWLKGVLFI